MIPDIELQLQIVIKSLKDNVLPAVDANNQLAQQQMQLSLATLEIALSHIPMSHQVIRKDITTHLDLAEKILTVCESCAVVDSLETIRSEAQACLNDPQLGITQLQVFARKLRDALGTVIADQNQSQYIDKIEQWVLASSLSSLHLGRSWNKPMGFEPNPALVKDLPELL